MTEQIREVTYTLMMFICSLIIMVGMMGCMLKSKVIKTLEPVDQALVIISAMDCSPLQVGSEDYFKCELAKANADMAHRVLSELGVNPIK